MNADGSQTYNLTQHSYADGDPAWSPDGKKIAFASIRDGNVEIYVMNVNGSTQVTNLTRNKFGDDYEPAWAP